MNVVKNFAEYRELFYPPLLYGLTRWSKATKRRLYSNVRQGGERLWNIVPLYSEFQSTGSLLDLVYTVQYGVTLSFITVVDI